MQERIANRRGITESYSRPSAKCNGDMQTKKDFYDGSTTIMPETIRAAALCKWNNMKCPKLCTVVNGLHLVSLALTIVAAQEDSVLHSDYKA